MPTMSGELQNSSAAVVVVVVYFSLCSYLSVSYDDVILQFPEFHKICGEKKEEKNTK
jgi:hypothetical protein